MSVFTLASVENVVLVTLAKVPNTSAALGEIFQAIGDAEINVDMICQTAPYKDKINLSFTIDQKDLAGILAVVKGLKEKYGEIATEINGGNCKLMIYSEALKTQWGVAARLFLALARQDLHVKLITTSDVEISLLGDRTEYERFYEVLKQEFLSE